MRNLEELILPRSISDYFKKEIKAAALKKDLNQILKRFIIISGVFSILSLLFIDWSGSGTSLVLSLIGYFLVAFIIIFIVILALFLVWLSVKKYNRKNKIEDVLADYLQLVSTNVGSGMTIDQSLWYAVRKRFGILSDEIEIVAKKIMGGMEVKEALFDFAARYDSDVLKKSITLLVEGMESGGRLAELIAKISWNIKENQLMKKQLASDTTVYVLFVGFATLIAAPVLFALSHRIIIVMSNIISNIDLSSAVGVSTKLPITKLGSSLDQGDFKIFAFISLFITSIVSSLIIGSVRRGDIKGGVKLIPIFIAISFILFLIASIILTTVFSNVGI